MVVLDSFPFQEDSDVQYLGGVRRSAHVSAGHHRRREIRFNSPEASLAESGNFSSDTTVYRSCEKEQAGNSQEYMQRVRHSQGYMEGVKNSEGYMKCRLCHYQTKIESLLRRHVIKHSLDSDFRCPACDFRENDPSKFVDHIGTHQSGKLVRCCFCPKKMSRGKLKSHIRIHRAVELYDCSMCQFSTNYEKTIKSHMDVYHTKEYPCHQCDLVMTKHDLHWHMKFVHSMEPTETGASQEQTVQLPVPAGRGTNSKTPRFPTKIIPNQSMVSRKFSASKISRKTSIALKLQKHVVAKKQFNCGKCDYKTAFKKLLRAHRAKHLLDNSLVCTKCGFKESGPGKFASHLALHSPKELFECCFCGFQTPTRGTMSNHVSKYKPVPMFDCSECEFSAKRAASVRIHTANVHGKRSRCRSCGMEMSRFAMSQHRKECHKSDNLNPGAAPSSQNLESEHYEPDTEPEASCNTGNFNKKDENIVTCEFCKKPYAKSYVRKHVKKCQIENAPDPESGRRNEPEAILPELHPVGNLDNDEFVAAVLNPHGISDCLEPVKSHDSVLSQSKSPIKSNKPKKPHLRCNSCHFKTRKKRLLRKHVVKHLIDFRLTCPECGHKEMSSFRFAHHILQHGSDPETFQCCFCSLSAPTSKRSYCAHLDLHRPVNIFDCSKCEYSSNRADSVRNHCKNNHSKNRKCWLCGEFMSKVRLIKHLLEYHGEVRDANFKIGKVDEPLPNEATSSYSHLQRIKPPGLNLDGQSTTQWQHSEDKIQEPAETSGTVHTEHNPTDFEVPLFETDQDFLKCTKCTFRTKIQSLMDRHIAKHLADVPFVCPLCGFEHMSSRKFANHWDKHECNAKKKIYQCCFCEAEIKKKNCLKAFLPQHIEDHRPVALQDCPECEFSSHSRYELDKHYKNQHIKKCECLLCGEVMTIFEHSFHTECKGTVDTERYNDSLETANTTDHQSLDLSTLRRRSAEVQESLIAALEDPASLFGGEPSAVADGSSNGHPEPRPHHVAKQYLHCSSCDYKSEFKSLLKRHVLKHLVDVPFSCKKCYFSSFDERTFADHIFTHTGSYKCHFCSFRAGNAGAAARHFSSHKVLALHDCPKCEYTSTYKYRLVEHLKGKHVNIPRCSYCGKKILKGGIYSHERVCGRTLKSKFFDHFDTLSAIEIPEGGLTGALEGKSPQVFAETNEHAEAPSGQVSGSNDDHFSSVERIRCADDAAMKGLLLHQLDLVPTQEHLVSDVESSQHTDDIGMLGSVHHSAEIQSGLPSTVGHLGGAGESSQLTVSKAVEVAPESNALLCLSDRVNPDMSTVAICVPAVNHESKSATYFADTSTHASTHDDGMPTVIQELKSAAVLSSQDPWFKHPVCLASTTEISTLTDRVPAVIQEPNFTAGTADQDPSPIDSV